MIRYVAPIAFVGLSACVVPIPTVTPTPAPEPVAIPEPTPNPGSAKERFVAAAVANGCVVDETTAPAILAGATLSQEELARILTELQTEGAGQIAADGRGFEVTTGACA